MSRHQSHIPAAQFNAYADHLASMRALAEQTGVVNDEAVQSAVAFHGLLQQSGKRMRDRLQATAAMAMAPERHIPLVAQLEYLDGANAVDFGT